MIVALTASGTGEPDVRITESQPADLVGETELEPGFSVEIDLAAPERWHSVTVRSWDDVDPALADAVLGADAVRRISANRPADRLPLEVAPEGPWQRIAVIDALDKWLQLPLNQALLNAERAVARARAARSLRRGPSREMLTEHAMVLARRSSDELARCLAELSDSAASLPRALFSGLSRLTNGYATLAREVDGPDQAFASVAEAWVKLKAAVRVAGSSRLADSSASYEVDHFGELALSSAVDPRQVRARIVDTDLRGPEIRLVMTPEKSAVRAMVPAYGPYPPSAVHADRLMIRLVDSRSGTAYEPVLLTLKSGREAERLGARTPVFTEMVPLRGARLEDLRADVFDPESEAPPAWTDTDDDLLRRRRAQFVLGEWRRVAAEARLSRGLKLRNRRLARMVDVLLETLPDAGTPAFAGGPSPADVARLIETGTLGSSQWFASTRGAGEPLVAELAAAYSGR
ncbi:hypothetical protein AB0L70_08785 [Kribbella sp. NPDC051952]|uniref:hypothetical protein n=1 Tax=Kribbella sp. NPDC051952 TaxID=3154851 RepID=UPI0034469992